MISLKKTIQEEKTFPTSLIGHREWKEQEDDTAHPFKNDRFDLEKTETNKLHYLWLSQHLSFSFTFNFLGLHLNFLYL